MAGCLFRGLGDDRYVQAAADNFGDVASRNALVGDPVVPGARCTLLERQPEKMGGVDPVHAGPAIEPFANVSRFALLPSDGDQARNEPVVAVPCTEGARRTTDARTPLAATEAAASSE